MINRDLKIGDRVKFISTVKSLNRIGIGSDSLKIIKNPYGIVAFFDPDNYENIKVKFNNIQAQYHYETSMFEPTNRRDI